MVVVVVVVVVCVQKHVIVLEEEVIPTQHFIELHACCLPAVDTDDTLVGVSAWNVNGLSLSLWFLFHLLHQVWQFSVFPESCYSLLISTNM